MSKFTVFLKTDSYVLIDHCHKSTAYILFATRQFNPTTGYPLQNYFFAASLTHLVYYFIRVQLFPSKFRRTECSSLLPRFELVSSFFFRPPSLHFVCPTSFSPRFILIDISNEWIRILFPSQETGFVKFRI